MADKKIKAKDSNSNISLFSKSLEVRRLDGELKSASKVSLSPWEFEGRHGFILQIKNTKIGKGTQQINIDPSNEDLRKAIIDAYEEYDRQVL